MYFGSEKRLACLSSLFNFSSVSSIDGADIDPHETLISIVLFFEEWVFQWTFKLIDLLGLVMYTDHLNSPFFAFIFEKLDVKRYRSLVSIYFYFKCYYLKHRNKADKTSAMNIILR